MFKPSTLIAAALLSTFATVGFAQTASPAPNGDTWAQNHPRRAEVNARLANQNNRIKTEVAEGEMSKARAAKLHKEDRQIRGEERAMASQNGSHITKQEQRTLNQQENHVSRQIGK
jgi:hypothetical protein